MGAYTHVHSVLTRLKCLGLVFLGVGARVGARAAHVPVHCVLMKLQYLAHYSAR